VQLPEDFYLRDNTLVFQWDAYEIAPYVMGSIEAGLTGEKLAGLLSARGKELLAGR
jgi:hypothetical protein